MMGDSQHLNCVIDFTINEIKVKNLEHCTSNIRGKSKARAIRRSTNPSQDIQKFGVIPFSQPSLNPFIVGDLFFVLFSCLGV